MTRALLAGSFAEIKFGNRPLNLYGLGSAGLGVIEDPGGGVVLPGQIRGFIATIDAAVRGLATDVAADLPTLTTTDDGRAFVTAWSGFVNEWSTWHARHTSTWSSLWGATNDQARALADRFNGFETTYTQLTGHSPSTPATVHQDAPGANQFLGIPAGVWLGVGGTVLALGFLAWGLNSYARVAAPMARVRARVAA